MPEKDEITESTETSQGCERRCLLMRMHYTHAGDVRNCIIKRLSVLQGYHGRCLAIGYEAYPIRHGRRDWHDHLALALFDFESEAWLRLWVESDPEIKQKDWLEGVDIISLPYHEKMDPIEGADESWLSIAECEKECPNTNMDDITKLATDAVHDMGSTVTVLQPESHNHYRGLYNPGKMVAILCDGKGERQCVRSPEEAEYTLPEVDVILFKLQALCLPLTTDTNPAAMVI